MKTVLVFGNSDLPQDSLPLKLLPQLRLACPEFDFKLIDPNENWAIPPEIIVIDTVMGLKTVESLTDLNKLIDSPRLSLHDFDVGFQLKYLAKLGRLKKVIIIGLPPLMTEAEALPLVTAKLRANLP
jgi:hypothetical protein